MNQKEQITQIIFQAIDVINRDLSEGEQIEKSVNTALMGQSATLDSLGIVNLIIFIQEEIQKKFGKTITLAHEDALSSATGPFNNVQSLVDYIDSQLNSLSQK